jgi:serine phosphatase RsbU (regulator of sigma subunit)
MMRIRELYILFIFTYSLILLGFNSSAQTFFPPVKNFGSLQYGREYAPENFSITQSKEGLIYVGNIGNVLEFDGTNWRSIPTINAKPVRSLHTSHNGTIYVGTFGDFGMLKSDSIGKLTYTSLFSNFKGAYKEFTDIWSIIETSTHIYFHAQEQLFEFDGKQLKALEMPSSVHTAFRWKDQLLVRMRGQGLMVYKNQKWEKLQGSEPFQEYGAFGILEYKNESLVITQEIGIWKINNSNTLESTNIINHTDYQSAAVFGAILLPNELIALQTYNQGVIVIDFTGKEIGRIDKRTGLNSNEVKNMRLDSDKNLWMALGNGLAVANIQSSLSFFNEKNGLFGGVQSIFEYTSNTKEILLVGTNEGLYVSGKNMSSNLAFEQIPEITQGVWDIQELGDLILVASSEGLFSFPKDFSSRPMLLDRNPVNSIYVDNQKKIIIFSGSKGTQVVRSTDFSPVYFVSGTFTTSTGIARQAFEDGNTDYWVGLHGQGLLKLSVSKKNTWSEQFVFGTDIGIPEDHILVPLAINEKVFFGSTAGLLLGETIDVDGENFFFMSNETIYDSTISRPTFEVLDTKKHLWTVINNQLGYFDKASSTYHNRPFWGINYGRINRLYSSHSNYLWIGAAEGLIRYELNKSLVEKAGFTTLIRSVYTSSGDQLFLGMQSKDLTRPAIQFSQNGVSITYSAPYFEDENPLEYSYRLIGLNDDWSDWSFRTTVEYTHLFEGNYTFEVKARNVYHQTSAIGSYSFSVLTPWYRSILAFSGYFIVLIIVIYLSVRISSARLKSKNIKLEKAVRERTNEIATKNVHLEKQKSQILHQKTEIEDSINYAKRIQEAILPLHNEISKDIPDNFILFWPKDVVSGDFYWFAKKGDDLVFVCADCTGHGVPGAFMSMIGSDKLNVCVIEKGITSPDQILSFLNIGIKASLKQDDSKNTTRDGMDAAIITINKKTKSVKFAGANRPLWTVMNGELDEVKATKVAIGGFTPLDQEFELHEFQYQSGMRYYLTTDGYPDQFGGEKDKKFKVKAMKDLFIEHYKLPMQEQLNILSETMKQWMDKTEQVDDICVIGLHLTEEDEDEEK